MKKAVAAVLVCIFLIPYFSALTINAEESYLSAKSAVLIEAETLNVLYQKNAFVKLPMASTTKIMTALVAIESGDIDRLVKVDDRARGVEGSSVYLAQGEVLSMRDLLYALMLASANDAAAAIAYEISGSVEDFAVLMNERAQRLGLTSTNFANPHGLHDDNHYTTAYDLALITAEALKNETFVEICSSKTKTIPLNLNEGTRYLTNHNKLLKSYEGCIGVKTGFTKNSGRCLVSAAERDGLRLIAVTLSAPDDWRDHKTMLDFGFANYKRLTLADKGGFTAALEITGGEVGEVIITNADRLSLFLPKSHQEITYEIEMIRPAFAPIKRGDTVGRIVYYQGGKEIASSRLIAVTSVKKAEHKKSLSDFLKRLLKT